MYIKVRNVSTGEESTLTVSKMTLIKELKQQVHKALNVSPESQRLFFRGKQLEDSYSVFDYSINLNDVVQLMIKCTVDTNNTNLNIQEQEAKSYYFKVGDFVDVLDPNYGAWFEGVILKIEKRCEVPSYSDGMKNTYAVPNVEDDGLLYEVELQGDHVSGDTVLTETIFNIRPRSRLSYPKEKLKVGLRAMVNYNIVDPDSLGYWYDFEIYEINSDEEISGTIYIGKDRLPLRNCKLKYTEFIMEIRHVSTERDISEEFANTTADKPLEQPVGTQKISEICKSCESRINVRCKNCGCHICGGKDEPHLQILCDECDMAYHLKCLNPPLQALPSDDEWYCPLCRNDDKEIVKEGGKSLESKKKLRMASKRSQSTSRGWGKGMACVGRTKLCTVVPANHFGPIPGIDVGMCWKFRVQVSETGVHRPHVAGIHGRDSDGAFSLVLSGGYEDDVDSGDTFLYSGSGGRDLSGNKRTAEQSCDQTLTRMNKALALNCNAPLNDNGAKAEDWKGGKPVRVVRNYKLAKHSQYAPDDGNRYDGIYKVREYYPEKGQSGFIVWRYVLQRDDPVPAPWTEEGKIRIEELGFDVVYPEGYLEAMGDREKQNTAVGKRERDEDDAPPIPKKIKTGKFNLELDIANLIEKDETNSKIWDLCKISLKEGRQQFLAAVTDNFTCICCMELVCKPVTTSCKHNFCLACLKRSFQAKIFTCPCCRCTVNSEVGVNEVLEEILLKLYPGYNEGR